MTILIMQDILDIQEGMVGQQVNCRKVAGGGLALATSKKWPAWTTHYRATLPVLGTAAFFSATPSLAFANLYGQDGFGQGLQTDYVALESALAQAVATAAHYRMLLYLPYQIGCGLAGGDWAIVADMIERVAPNAYICKPPWMI